MKELIVSKNHGADIVVKVNDIRIGNREKVIMSGPCSVEDYDTMIGIAKDLKKLGVNILRGGAFKPRTSPYDFQGLEYKGLEILRTVGREFSMPVVTEIMDIRDIEIVSNYTDIIQIGARNMYNYSLLKELGKSKLPIILKRGISATIVEWLNAAEYIMLHGNSNIILCERGIRTFEDFTRNTLDLSAVAIVKKHCRLPIIVDPSHGTGLRELILPMSLAAIAAGADGLLIESHINPDSALSDSKQTISIEALKEIICKIRNLKDVLY
jgi:3-deoxy-7-phosphoheptulonate synthase